MKKKIKNITASTRARLLNIARSENIDFDFLLLRFFQERFLYRLSISDFSQNFILKGGLLLVYLNIPKSRPTIDIDLLAKRIKNNPAIIQKAICSIAQISCDDGVIFSPSSIIVEQIKEEADYTGIRIKIDAFLGQAKKRIQLDISFGDVIIPRPLNIEFPTLLDTDNPKIAVYSIESIIAEKFEAMVKLAMINSRMKDFYDIYSLSFSQNFKSNSIKKAIESTFSRRKTIFPENPVIFRSEFHHDKYKQQQWMAFLRKTNIRDINNNFDEIMDRITIFLKPIVSSIKDKTNDDKIWDINDGIWK